MLLGIHSNREVLRFSTHPDLIGVRSNNIFIVMHTKLSFLYLSGLVLGFLGFLDATYLAILHFRHAFPPCTLAKTCEVVLTSSYATFLGIPIALFGSLFYVAVIVLLLTLWQRGGASWGNKFLDFVFSPLALFLLCFAGLLFGVYLVYIQFFVLHATCQYCLTSEGISLLLLVASGLLLFSRPKITPTD